MQAAPQRIIRSFEATLDGRTVLSATFYRSLSMNPYLRVDIAPQQGGEMRFEWTEDTGRKAEHKAAVRLG